MASRPWSDDELLILQSNADRRDWFDRVVSDFPRRSAASLRSMMQKVRCDMGKSTPQRFVENAWMADAHMGSQRLLQAQVRLGVYP